MKVAADLTLELTDGKARRSLSAVLAPDNEGLPKGLRLSTREEGSTLGFRVESDSLSSALSTILALVRDVALFQEVWLLSRTERA